MRKTVFLSWNLLFLFLLMSYIAIAQTVTIIPNPDNGGGYTDQFNSESFEPLVEMDNVLYGRYVDARGKGRLIKFDGTILTLIPNPDDNAGVYGNMVACNHAIYVQYSMDKAGRIAKTRIAKYDGSSLTLIDNPDAGLGFYGSPVLKVFNNLLYGRYLDVNQKFHLVRIDNSSTSLPFGFTGVKDVNCTIASSNLRIINFTPEYTGQTGGTITFSVINEMEPTTKPGPYTLNLYSDNPIITLKAIQAGSPNEALYSFNWLRSCPIGARKAAEKKSDLNIVIMPNPSSGPTIDIEVTGVIGQPLDFQLEDERGIAVSHIRIEQAAEIERNTIKLGSETGIYLLKVNTPTQSKTLKVLKK